MTREEFIDKEIKTWGIDYIDALFTKGYEVVQSVDTYGNVKFGWRVSVVSERQLVR